MHSAKALSAAGNISVSLGDYSGAISDAQQAIELRQGSKKDEELATDYNTLGRANQYLGNYTAALNNYQTALGIDRAVGPRWERTALRFFLHCTLLWSNPGDFGPPV